MPKTLTGNAASFPDQTSPLAGEPRTAGSVETPFQRAADRAQYLFDRLLFLDPNKGGIRRVRRFANVVALKASTDHADGTVALVAGLGLYQYEASRTTVETLPFVVTPDDVGASGRWVLDGFEAFNVANGIAQLDALAQLPLTRLAGTSGGRIQGTSIANGRTQLATGFSTGVVTVPNTTTFATALATVWSGTLAAGDLVLVDYEASFAASVNDKLAARIRITKPDTSTEDSVFTWTPTGHGGPIRMRLFRPYTALADGNHTFALQLAGVGGNVGTNTVNDFATLIEVVKP